MSNKAELTAVAILSFQQLLLFLLANLVYYILDQKITMLKDKIKDIFVGLVLALLPMIANAQPRYIGELGLRGGISFYNGDINSSKVFRDVSPAAGAFLRFKANEFLSFKLDGGFANLKCDARDYTENAMPDVVVTDNSGIYPFAFDKRIMTFDAFIIWNFFKYGFSSYDKDVKRHTPYAMLGPSVSMAKEWSGNEWRMGLAFGAGYKFKLSQRVNIGVEFTMHKLFSDDLDISEYDYLDDPYHMGSQGYKNNDYYSQLMGFISIDVFRKRGSCRYIGR